MEAPNYLLELHRSVFLTKLEGQFEYYLRPEMGSLLGTP